MGKQAYRIQGVQIWEQHLSTIEHQSNVTKKDEQSLRISASFFFSFQRVFLPHNEHAHTPNATELTPREQMPQGKPKNALHTAFSAATLLHKKLLIAQHYRLHHRSMHNTEDHNAQITETTPREKVQ